MEHPPSNVNYFYRGINIDISNKCPLQCPSCDRIVSRDMVKRAGDITLENYSKLINTFPFINMCGQISDPIYHPKFHILLRMSSELDGLLVNTNGSGKKQSWWEESFSIGINNGNVVWQFSLDGLPDESHKYRVNQNGEQVWEMMKLGAGMGADVKWQYIPFKYNETHIDEAYRMASDHGIDFFLTLSSRHPKGLEPTRSELKGERIRLPD
tara:strand:- start:1617 stop:2249 length:633 start_codon:yes stop_codon:yes gene_type:complete